MISAVAISLTCLPHQSDTSNALTPVDHRHHLMMQRRDCIRNMALNTSGGTVRTYNDYVEWQARGEPHVHLWFVLQEGTDANAAATTF